MPDPPRDREHVYLESVGVPTPYTRQGGGGATIQERDRIRHAAHLETMLTLAQQAALAAREVSLQVGHPGFYLEFELLPGEAEKQILASLETVRRGIEVASVHVDPLTGSVFAIVAVPDDAEDVFKNKLSAYRDENTAGGKPKNARLMTNVEGIRHAALRSIYVGRPNDLPPPTAKVWWEIWLRRGGSGQFRELAQRVETPISERLLTFPDREIVLAYGSFDDMSRIFLNSVVMAEIRLALDTPNDFIRMSNDDQTEWAENMLSRIEPLDADTQTSVLVLDSGTTRGHPLIEPFLHPDDWRAWQVAWGPNDMSKFDGHGTAMAGLALHGDLHDALISTGTIKLSHRLESVKILPPIGYNKRELYGLITRDAVSLMELANPERWRVICLAVTAELDANRGRPTAWSSTLDQLASGAGDEAQRLIVVSAGNSRPTAVDLGTDYINFADTSQVHSPAQAWNALTIGAYTEKTSILDPLFTGWAAVAPVGDLAPTSSTSLTWIDQWPIKPDLVFEGGNIILDGGGLMESHPDVRLMTTEYDLGRAHFRDFGDTSGAAALGARMAAQLAAAHPNYWPETIRALMTHSADWTPAMLAHRTGSKKQGNRLLLRRYGYGVPNLERAQKSAKNDLTLVIQDSVRPFKREGGRVRTNEMHLHRFPWSSLDLSAFEGIELEMRITLSYFIEPNPSERGFAQRFRYASHGLRFAVKGPLEDDAGFKARIQHESMPDEGGSIRDAGNEYWELGPDLRTSGSIHSDRWKGDIASLRNCEAVLVYPVSGWWREKRGGDPEFWDRDARYSLIVGLRVPSIDIDVYTSVVTALGIPVSVET